MKLYLAGPMRGIKENNFPAFHFAAQLLRDQGYEVFCPAEKGEETRVIDNPEIQNDLSFRRLVFKLDTAWICEHADAIALLPGWEASKGARCEKATAEAIGLTIIELGSEYVQ